MPIDPATGERLPYPGEPGGGPPPQGAAPGQGPSPEDVAAQAAAANQAEVGAVGAAAPQPEGDGYKSSTIASVVKTINIFADNLDALAKKKDRPPVVVDDAGNPARVAWDAPKGQSSWDQPLPPAVWLPLVAIDTELQRVGLDKHRLEPDGIVSDKKLKMANSRLMRLARDKKALEEMLPPEQAELPTESAGPPSGEMSDVDKQIMEKMPQG